MEIGSRGNWWRAGRVVRVVKADAGCIQNTRWLMSDPWLPLNVWPTEPGRYWFYGERFAGMANDFMYADVRVRAMRFLGFPDQYGEIVYKHHVGPFRFCHAEVPAPPSLEASHV
jgi:hypothetical protein